MLKYVTKGAVAGVSLTALLSCSRDIGIFEPALSPHGPALKASGVVSLPFHKSDLIAAEKIVTQLCEYDLKGYLLGGNYDKIRDDAIAEIKGSKIVFPEIVGDSLKIVKNYTIKNRILSENMAIVEVNYTLLAVANGDDVNIDDSTINSKYYVSKDADGFVIRIGNNSFVSKNTAERLFDIQLYAHVSNKDKIINHRYDKAIKTFEEIINNKKNSPKKINYYKKLQEKLKNGFYNKRSYEKTLKRLNDSVSILKSL